MYNMMYFEKVHFFVIPTVVFFFSQGLQTNWQWPLSFSDISAYQPNPQIPETPYILIFYGTFQQDQDYMVFEVVKRYRNETMTWNGLETNPIHSALFWGSMY